HIVTDAASSDRAAIVSGPEGGPMSILYAATYPERTSALALINSSAALLRGDDYPWGLPPTAAKRYVDEWLRSYTNEESASLMIGSLTSDEDDMRQMQRLARFAQSPGRAIRFARANLELDVRDVLPSVRVPTLVIHRRDNRHRRVGHGRYLAEHIVGAKY